MLYNLTFKPFNHTGTSRRSFNGKAAIASEAGRVYLKSYSTIVGYVEGERFHRTWGGYSATTMTHVNGLLSFLNVSGGGKAWWENLPVEAA